MKKIDKIIASILIVTFSLSNVAYTASADNAAASKTATLAPLVLSELAPQSEDEIRAALKSTKGIGTAEFNALMDGIVGRVDNAKRGYGTLNLVLWMRKAFAMADQYHLASDLETVKRAYIIGMTNTAIRLKMAERGVQELTEDEKRIVREGIGKIWKDANLDGAFDRIYRLVKEQYKGSKSTGAIRTGAAVTPINTAQEFQQSLESLQQQLASVKAAIASKPKLAVNAKASSQDVFDMRGILEELSKLSELTLTLNTARDKGSNIEKKALFSYLYNTANTDGFVGDWLLEFDKDHSATNPYLTQVMTIADELAEQYATQSVVSSELRADEWIGAPMTLADLNSDMFRDYDYRTRGGEVSPAIAFRMALTWAKMAIIKADELGIINRTIVVAKDTRMVNHNP